jgi:hypothetical protein
MTRTKIEGPVGSKALVLGLLVATLMAASLLLTTKPASRRRSRVRGSWCTPAPDTVSTGMIPGASRTILWPSPKTSLAGTAPPAGRAG